MGTIHINNQEKPNSNPTVNAGVDQIVNLPVNSVSLAAVAGDPDGVITTVQWTQLAGGNAIIASPNTLSTQISGMNVGSYTFQVKVTDNRGAQAIDTVVIVVGTFLSEPFMWMGDPDTLICVQGGTTTTASVGELGIELGPEFQFYEVTGTEGNTGMQVPTLLRKVTSDGNQTPLDVNNIKTSVSGNPQHTKPNFTSDPDYIFPIENLLDCPIPIVTSKRFHTLLGTQASAIKTVTSPPSGGGMGNAITGLDTSQVIENTLGGFLISMNGTPVRILDVTESGLHHIKFHATGGLLMWTDNSANWETNFSFYLDINGQRYPLSPMKPFQYFPDAQYHFHAPAGNAQHRETLEGYTLDFDETINLLAGSHIDLYMDLSFITIPAGKSASYRMMSTTMELDIQT